MVTDDRGARDLMGHDSRARFESPSSYLVRGNKWEAIRADCTDPQVDGARRDVEGARRQQHTNVTQHEYARARSDSWKAGTNGTDAHNAVHGVSSTRHREAATE